MNGIEFFAELRADPIKTDPVIVLTTSNQDRDKVEASQHECSWIYSQTCYILEFCGSGGN